MLFGPTLAPPVGPAAGLVWYVALDNFQSIASSRNRTIQDAQALITLASTTSEEIINAPAYYPVWVGRLYYIVSEKLKEAFDRVGTTLIDRPFVAAKMMEDVGLNDAGVYTAIQQLRTAYGEYQQAQRPPESQKKLREEVPAWDLSQAMVDEQQLLDHIRANKSYYQYAVWAATSSNDRQDFLSALGNLLGWVDNEVLGFLGGKAALPLRLEDHPEVQEWFEGNVLENKPLYEPPEPYTVTLPTPGVTLETRLGQCDGCEEFIAQSRTLELQRTAAEVKSARERALQEELETTRYEKRLEKEPPLLDDPDPNENRGTIRIEVSKEDDSQEGG